MREIEIYKILEEIQYQAKASNLARVMVVKEDSTLLDWGVPNQLLQSYSITKSIMGLGIGLLWDKGFIQDLHLPLYSYFPELYQGHKEKITLWHLLTHTSGIQEDPSYEDIIRAPDAVQLALCAELVSVPGEKYNYSNKATNLLPAIIGKISGQTAEQFIKENFFDPLNIKNFEWRYDKVGMIYGASGLKISAEELLKIGHLLLQHGQWHETQLISQEWLSLMTIKTSKGIPACGLLWWVYEEPTVIAAQGHLGQRLYILPQTKIVAIQQYDRDVVPSGQPHDIVDLRSLVIQL